MSRATSFASVAQQLSLSAGVAIGALVLELERMGRNSHEVLLADFPSAFVLVSAIAASSALIFATLRSGVYTLHHPRLFAGTLSRFRSSRVSPYETVTSNLLDMILVCCKP